MSLLECWNAIEEVVFGPFDAVESQYRRVFELALDVPRMGGFAVRG